MRKTLRLAVALALALAPLGAWASFEETLLFSSGAWRVTASYNTDTGILACWAETWNNQGQAFSLVVDQTVTVPSLLIYDGRWQLRPGPQDFIVDVDYERWNMQGNADVNSVAVPFYGAYDANAPRRFMQHLMVSNAVALLNTRLDRLAVFSLYGSSRAIQAFGDCWSRLSGYDPF